MAEGLGDVGMSEVGPASLVGLAAGMILSARVGLDLVEAAGELIAEDARFNKWVHARKAESTAVELWNLAALAKAQQEDCSAAWSAYLAAGAESRSTRYQELIALLKSQGDQLRAIRISGVIDYRDPGIPPELLDW